MNQIKTDYCKNCTSEIFFHSNGEHTAMYEDMLGTIPHTKLRCEINQIVSKRVQELRIEINKIKERMNL